MIDYKIIQILYPIYVIVTFLPVIRFYNNKYFYYLFIISMIDPIYIIITNLTQVPPFNYLPIFILILFIGLPFRLIMQKVLVFIVILILVPRLGQFPLLELMINQIIFFYIIYFFVDDLVKEIKQNGTLKMFLLLLIVYLMFDAIRVYIYYENIELFTNTFTITLIILILIPILITIVGPETKIKILNKESITSLDQSNDLLPNVNEKTDGNNLDDIIEKLTPIEGKVLIEIGKGKKNKEIALLLGKNPRTIYFYLRKIKTKLNFNNNNQLVKFAVDNRDRLSIFEKESDI